MGADHYDVLGVTRDASPDDIKRAYRRLARELHPDANPDDPQAEARFKEVARAYEVLSDPEQRARFDRFGDVDDLAGGAGPFGAQGFGGIGDIFDAFFGGNPFGGGGGARSGPPSGPDIEAVVDLDFEAAVFGGQAPVTVRTAVPCQDCEGSGAEGGTYPSTCPECNGAGQVRRVRQSILGQMVTAGPCPRCEGFGSVLDHPCPHCAGEGRLVEERTYTVEIPAGIEDGRTLRLGGRGAVGPRGGRAGDLYLHVRVAPHAQFERHGNDLHTELAVSFAQAALGTTLTLATLDGDEELVLERGTQTGSVVRLRGRGVPYVEGRGRGDLFVHLLVVTPDELTDEEEELLRRLAELRGEAVAPPAEGFFSRLKSAFK